MHAMIGEDAPRDHPSNRLYRGEITEFPTATYVYEQAVNHEIKLGYASLEELAWWNRELNACHRARQIWEQTDEESDEVTIYCLRAASLDIWADALESGDYTQLAF
jgi:hypothetical protein